jgi:hypothetical protein
VIGRRPIQATSFSPSRRGVGAGPSEGEAFAEPEDVDHMTIGAALVVILAGVLIAAFLNGTIGLIVAIIGVCGLALALFSTARGRSANL